MAAPPSILVFEPKSRVACRRLRCATRWRETEAPNHRGGSGPRCGSSCTERKRPFSRRLTAGPHLGLKVSSSLDHKFTDWTENCRRDSARSPPRLEVCCSSAPESEMTRRSTRCDDVDCTDFATRSALGPAQIGTNIVSGLNGAATAE